ncbi:hypothetical protein D3C83_89920 [compost metagenome]
MQFDAVELGARERAWFVPDRVGDRRGAEVVYERRAAQREGGLRGKPEHARGIGRKVRATPAVTARIR